MSVHLRVPFEISGDRALVVDDGSEDEIIQNVAVIVGTFRGERLTIPDFGITDPTFEMADEALDTAELEAVIEQWEPRAEASFTRTTGERQSEITIQVATRTA